MVTKWGRRSRLTFFAALFAELLLPSPAALGRRWGVPPWEGQDASLSLALAAQDQHTGDLLQLDGVVGTAVGLGLNGMPVVMVYMALSLIHI